MSALDTITTFETVQFIMVVGIGAICVIGMIVRAIRKGNEQSYTQTKESREVNNAHELLVLQAKAVAGSIPGKALTRKNPEEA
jgi:hypothetical protein